jgi:lysyl-tRNA synthetase class 2
MPTHSERDFRPTADIASLRRRSELVQQTRAFFHERGYWEVETPLLSAETVVDAHIDPVQVLIDGDVLFLQTSPELAMKRLLAAGSGSIFQFAHAVRRGESGARHNREFTLLEWYRVGADLNTLMDEVAELTQQLLPIQTRSTLTYRDAFRQATSLDPISADEQDLWRLAAAAGLASRPAHRDDLLNFLWADRVEPTFPPHQLLFIEDYPASQAALARTRIDREGDPVAQRFELYAGGMELANGYHELDDPNELRRRFLEQNRRRATLGKESLPLPTRLLAAHEQGLPPCSGVAMGFDRIVMLRLGLPTIDQSVAFPDCSA